MQIPACFARCSLCFAASASASRLRLPALPPAFAPRFASLHLASRGRLLDYRRPAASGWPACFETALVPRGPFGPQPSVGLRQLTLFESPPAFVRWVR